MYKVFVNRIMLCDSRVDELAILKPIVILEANKAGSFSFEMLPDHPLYDFISQRNSLIDVYQDNDEEPLFSGICTEMDVDFYKKKKIYCEGDFGFFNDSIQRPARYQDKTVRQLLTEYVNNHNAQVDDYKKFEIGQITVSDSNDSIYCYTNMESTMKCFKDDLVDDYGGFFNVRHENGKRYLDYLAEPTHTSSQIIRLGKNLLDFTTNIDATDIATAIIPLGKKLDASTVEGLETRLDIKEVNEGLDYVFSEEAVRNYGWIYKTAIFDDVTIAENLKNKGIKYLQETQFENMVINAKAIDLGLVEGSIEKFKLYDDILVISEPHGLRKHFILSKMQIDLNNPSNNTVTLGIEEKYGIAAKSSSVSDEIKKAVESIVPASTIIEQARENATNLIINAMGGYVYKTNSELYIMDTNDPQTAQKVWRWNINGLGYSSNGIDGPYELAMTMDGSIVANFIKTGTMFANRIKGGTLTLGGENNTNGTIIMNNNSGKEVGHWDNSGLSAIGSFQSLANVDGWFADMTYNGFHCHKGNNNVGWFGIAGNDEPIINIYAKNGFWLHGFSNDNTLYRITEDNTGYIHFIEGTIHLYSPKWVSDKNTTRIWVGGWFDKSPCLAIGASSYNSNMYVWGNEFIHKKLFVGNNVRDLAAANPPEAMIVGGNTKILGAVSAEGAISSGGNISAEGNIYSKGKFFSDNGIELGNGYSIEPWPSDDRLFVSRHISGSQVDAHLHVVGNLSCSGTKNRIVETEHHGNVAMNSMESAEAFFSDLGSAVCGANGISEVVLDEIFLETVEGGSDYFVQITNTSDYGGWVEKLEGKFRIHSVPNASFDWIVYCKQKGFADVRMNEVVVEEPILEESEGEE